MTRVHVVVEGQAEEAFVKTVLYPHFLVKGILLNAILAPNRRGATARVHRGGGHSFRPALFAIKQKLKEDPSSYCTTLVDYYAIPEDFPGLDHQELPPPISLDERIAYLEREMDRAAGATGRLIPYLQLHEFEAILFSDTALIDGTLAALDDYASRQVDLDRILREAGNPEAINDGPATAPSKRLLRLYPGYNKVVFGPLIAERIGLGKIRSECPHFNRWISRLEGL